MTESYVVARVGTCTHLGKHINKKFGHGGYMSPFHRLPRRKGFGRRLFHLVIDNFVLDFLRLFISEDNDNGVDLRSVTVGEELR